MEISVRQISIKPHHMKQLLANGIVLVSHLIAFDKSRLSNKTKLSLDECEQILAAVKPRRPHYIMKSSELMIKPFEKIPTPMSCLNYILDGGIHCGQLTEISGEAGVGKSNLCAEIGVSVMLPERLAGLGGDVLLIHSEGVGKLKLCIKRFRDLAGPENFEELLSSKLHVMSCSNEYELAEIATRLPDTLDNKPTVRMVIVDSMTCAFISSDAAPDFEFYARRSLRLTKIVKTLADVAWNRRIAIVITNHVAYDPSCGHNKPALGKYWSHMCQTKIYLDRRRDRRFAHVIKGAVKEPSPVEFTISACLVSSDLKQN